MSLSIIFLLWKLHLSNLTFSMPSWSIKYLVCQEDGHHYAVSCSLAIRLIKQDWPFVIFLITFFSFFWIKMPFRMNMFCMKRWDSSCNIFKHSSKIGELWSLELLYWSWRISVNIILDKSWDPVWKNKTHDFSFQHVPLLF